MTSDPSIVIVTTDTGSTIHIHTQVHVQAGVDISIYSQLTGVDIMHFVCGNMI